MIKLTFALTRRPDLTREAFQAYWLHHHAPLVKTCQHALRIRRYVQLHSLPPEISADLRASRNAPEPFDGVAQLWWDSLEDVAAATATQEGQAAGLALLQDEQKFIDLPRSPLWWGNETVIF